VGLGLAISKALVEMMGGKIQIHSEPERGSCFTVRLPLLLAEEASVMQAENPLSEVVGLAPGQPEWRILVVDDNPDNRLLLTDMISRVGFSVKDAQNGEEAIVEFKRWHPHFIWMDMRMPVMDGYEATRRIRTLPGGETLKIVAVTASVLEEHRQEILASGCDDLVRKPFQYHEIFEAMAGQLDIKYLYKEDPGEPVQKQRIDLSAEMLAKLPPKLLQALRETTLALDREAILEVIEGIEEHAPDTAADLRRLVQDFQVRRIRELLGKVKS